MSEESHRLVCLAIGRLFRLGSRPTQPGDVEQYEQCRAIIMGESHPVPGWEPNYARDHNKGAQGQ